MEFRQRKLIVFFRQFRRRIVWFLPIKSKRRVTLWHYTPVSLNCYITYGSVVKELDIVHNQSECRKDYIVFKWSNQSVGVSSKKQRTDNWNTQVVQCAVSGKKLIATKKKANKITALFEHLSVQGFRRVCYLEWQFYQSASMHIKTFFVSYFTFKTTLFLHKRCYSDWCL